MKVTKTAIKDLVIIEPDVYGDSRGFFFESYNQKTFTDAGVTADFVQDNQSFSHKGTVRGLHCQAPPFAQGKLVRVISGRVLDIAVDIRQNSPTYGKHVSVELSGENKKLFWIPAGFLHGFVTLENGTIFSYKVDNYYDKVSEVGVKWDDPGLGIDWVIAPGDAILSPKDEVLQSFATLKSPF